MRYGHCHRVLDFLLDPLFLLYIPWIDNRYLIKEFPGNAIVPPPLTSCTSGPRASVVSRCVDLRNQNHNCPLMSFVLVASSPLMLLPNHRSPRRYIYVPLPSFIPDPPSLSPSPSRSRLLPTPHLNHFFASVCVLSASLIHRLTVHFTLLRFTFPMSSPLSLSSRSSSRSSSFSDVSRSDEPCQAAFAVRPPISLIYRIVDYLSLYFTDRRNGLGARRAHLARRARHLARVPEVLRSMSLSLPSPLPPFTHTQIISSPPTNPRPTQPYLPTVRTWDIAILSTAHPAGVHTTPLSPALGHLKPATPAVLGVLQHEGLVPRAWVYGAPELTCQVYELHKRLGAAGIPF